MANQLEIVSETLRSPQITGRLMLALGCDDPKNQTAINEAKKYAASVLAELEKMACDPKKKDILECHPLSIAQVMIDAAKFKLMIDGRQHAHILQYGKTASLQLGYRAFLYKVKEHYPDADITVRPIYEGESVRVKDENGFQTYTVEGDVDPFDAKEDSLRGVMVAVTYTDGGRLISKCMPILKNRIDRAQKAAKQDFIWKSDYIEKAKAAAIKAAFKILFTQIQALQEMVDYDNKTHFEIDKTSEDIKSGSIIDNINATIEPPKKIEVIEENPDYKRICTAIDFEESKEGLAAIETDFAPEFEALKKSEPDLYEKAMAHLKNKSENF